MPPYIFNRMCEPSILFFNKTRFCSFPPKTSTLIAIGGGVVTTSTLSYYLYSKCDFNWLWLRNILTKWTSWTKSVGDDPVKKIESYENKYYDEYDNLESRQLEEDSVKSLLNNVLFESTPKGGIAMYYDFEKESFVYYCDTKDIPYLFLETVARKYAVTFHCKIIVVDMKQELMLAKEKKNNILVTNGIGDDVSTKDNLFASFKSYNRKGSVDGTNSTNKKFVLRQQANRYSYGGKVGQFSILKPDEYKIEKPTDNMNYETFKKLMAKKN